MINLIKPSIHFLFILINVTVIAQNESLKTDARLQGAWRCIKGVQLVQDDDSTITAYELPIYNVEDHLFRNDSLFLLTYPCSLNKRFHFETNNDTLNVYMANGSHYYRYLPTYYFSGDTLIFKSDQFRYRSYFLPLELHPDVLEDLFTNIVHPLCLTETWDSDATETMYLYDNGEETDPDFIMDSTACFMPSSLDFNLENDDPISYTTNELSLKHNGIDYSFNIVSFILRRRSEYVLVLETKQEDCRQVKARYFKVEDE